MDSEDSDFYGDEATVAGLRDRVNAFDIAQWWEDREGAAVAPCRNKAAPDRSSHLHNPYAGCSYAWQLTETVDDFLARLPPATTDRDPQTPWIYICNPYIPRKPKSEGQNQRSRGNEDEAPEEEGSRLDVFIEGGQERLNILRDFMENMSKSRKSKSVISREINEQKKEAVKDILDLAHGCHVRAGKWMLFCTSQDINEVWEVIAKATANNELGIAAKVMPRQENDSKNERVVAVYTADFAETKDIERVLQKLRELKLVETKGKPIYYKPDAFTYLGIAYGNVWELRASILSSFDFFGKKPNGTATRRPTRSF